MASPLVACAIVGFRNLRVLDGGIYIRQHQPHYHSNSEVVFSARAGANPFFLHYFVRKTGHVTEYFILSLLVLRGIRAGKRGVHLGWALAAIAIVGCYAALDEFHQSFVPGRTAAVSDVLLDTAGGIAAQVVVGLGILFAIFARNGETILCVRLPSTHCLRINLHSS